MTNAEPIEVTIQPPVALQRADERFILFLKRATFPITEPQIIDWYQRYVQMSEKTTRTVYDKLNDMYIKEECEYDATTVRLYALAWFDRSLGRTIRKAIIPREAIKLLTPIREEQVG